ncbi:MAG: hypothetical protein HUJ26_09525 [Planctomycetaceae bacterium]|nr:hypothetical protein [Planctomycetaceae bacterium]
MKQTLRFLLAILILWQVSIFTASAQEPAKPVASMTLEDGDSLVFLGDSITHQCLYTQYVEDYLYTRFPAKRFQIHNAGVGGARAWDALQRFDKDVAAFKPKYVTILLGMNDGEYQPFNREVFDTYQEDMSLLLEKLDGIGTTSILMTPTMFDSQAPNIRERTRQPEILEEYNSVMAYFGTWLREVATDEGRGFVDMWSPLNNITLEERKKEAGFTLIRDGIHPDSPGQVVMATAIINDMRMPKAVSTIRILTGGKKPTATATGGELSDLLQEGDTLTFTWTAKSLPWVVPEEAQLGAELTRLGHRYSREAVEIHGLAPGRYELSIDGTVVGEYSHAQLGRHIELQSNSKTPQYQQALKIAEANKERNQGPVRGLRNQWSQFQRYARIKRQAEANPDNEDLAKQLAEWSKWIEGMDERVAELIAQARTMEDKIFEINKPHARKYVLRKVK